MCPLSSICPIGTEEIGCYSILLARLQGEQLGANSSFAQTREQLNQNVQKSPGNALLLGYLAMVDALLNFKEAAISEAKRAIEMLPISKDAVDGPALVVQLAVAYARTNELDLAFEALDLLTKRGQLRTACCPNSWK